MEKGVQRWMVDISKWDPTPHDFSLAVSLLPQHEHSSITRFVKWEDRKRALVSRLLQYSLVHEVLGIPYDEIIIKRTIEGKPYLECDQIGMEFPNFNFNVSHHGDYVAIASEPLCLVGLDIVSYVLPHRETIPEFIQNFSSYFSSQEWHKITNAGAYDEILIEFYRYWCLKEAYVKAMGSGLSYGLDKVEFHHTGWTDISVKIDGVAMIEWRFWLFELEKRHWVSVARGPPRSAAESYKRTLTQTEFNKEDYNKECLVLDSYHDNLMKKQVKKVELRQVGGGTRVGKPHVICLLRKFADPLRLEASCKRKQPELRKDPSCENQEIPFRQSTVSQRQDIRSSKKYVNKKLKGEMERQEKEQMKWLFKKL